MALDSIGGNNNISYAGLMKQPVNRDTRTTTQPKNTSAEIAKEIVPAFNDSAKNTEVTGSNSAETGGEEKAARRLKDAIDQVNKKMQPTKTKCEFSYHEETKRVSIKVIDEDTEEVIREIPPEETLEMLTKMWELAGLLVDERR